MKKIRVFCNMGMSTSVLVKNMNKAAEEMGYEVDIKANSVGLVKKEGADADIVLLGPQIAYELKKVQKELPEKPVFVIETRDYGMMDGKKVIEFVRRELDS